MINDEIYQMWYNFVSDEKYKKYFDIDITSEFDTKRKLIYHELKNVKLLTSNALENNLSMEVQYIPPIHLLQQVKDYCDGKKDFYQIVGYSKRV